MNPIIADNILLIVLIAICAVSIVLFIKIDRRITNLLGGTQSKDIEQGLQTLRTEIKEMQAFAEKASAHFHNIEKRLRKSIQAVETIRFNPFKGTGAGGNQSFSTSFTNEHGDGVVISTLHSRERISVFSKPLKSFSSEFELSDEEKDVISKAKNSLEQK